MKYIYDISLNFNKELYSFYEWNVDDSIDFFLKIPIFKIEENELERIINNNITVEKRFLSIIKNQSELYSKDKKYEYVCILCSEEYALGISFDNKGKTTMKSSILIEDLDDILDYSKLIKYTLFDYRITENNSVCYLTRNEKIINKELKNIINSIYKNEKYDVLKYIYYELYNEKNDDIEKVYLKIKNVVENSCEKTKKLFDLTKKIPI